MAAMEPALALDQHDRIPVEKELQALARAKPFQCHTDGLEYSDYGPTIVVVLPTGTALFFCSDSCAEEAGYTEAVYARWHAEAQHEGLTSIVYRV
jgi:hypothetical protein